jgi:lipopolysaccharide/colanic/teichoic acid biosynthesis glycosyltransferase
MLSRGTDVTRRQKPIAAGVPLGISIKSETDANIGEYPSKRLFDLLLLVIAFIVSAPFWMIIPLLIKLEDRGSVFFIQQRWGHSKRRIRVYKFRTMVPNAMELTGNVQAAANDQRITRVGRILRSASLDEMPQLLNILKGDMSWVGPRSLPINEMQVQKEDGWLPDEAIPGFDLRAKMRPGLTGIAQVYASRTIRRRHKFRYDILYLKKQGLWLDLKLIFLSGWLTVSCRWGRGRRGTEETPSGPPSTESR